MTTKKKGPAGAPAMKVARIYSRVSTEEQDLSRPAVIVDNTRIAGCYRIILNPAITRSQRG